MNVISQPYSRPTARKDDHFAATVEREVDLAASVAAAGMTDRVDLSRFVAAHGRGTAPIWAFKNNSIGPGVFAQTSVGDLVVFYGNRQVYAYAIVASKVQWPGNDFVWPTGTSWDFIYSLRDVVILPPDERVTSRRLREALSNFTAQSAQVHHLEQLGTTPQAALSTIFAGSRHVPHLPGPGGAAAPPPEADVTATALCRRLVGLPLRTASGHGHTIRGVDSDHVVVAMERSNIGLRVPIIDVQHGLDQIRSRGWVDLAPHDVDDRGAFVGAVLLTLPGAHVTGSPPRLSFDPTTAGTERSGESGEGRDYTFDGDLNLARQGLSRGEQGLLRHVLMGNNKVAACALCGRQYPIEFLRAAHIKRRSVCTDAERRDLRHVANVCVRVRLRRAL